MYQMYSIKEIPIKIPVSCEFCSKIGFINKNCPKCGGRGIHNKTIKIWKTKPRIIEIVKINRASTNYYYKGELIIEKNELIYWIDNSSHYNENDKLIHFTKIDAQNECDKRNIEKYGIDFYKQYIKSKFL